MDRLTSLTAFVRVADSGGFSAAGRRLNMSTTMVSNHVLALEERLGARLLNRTTRKVSLTEVGKAYYDRAIQILADIEQADDIAGALQSTPRGTLRLSTVEATAIDLVGYQRHAGGLDRWFRRKSRASPDSYASALQPPHRSGMTRYIIISQR